MSDYLDILCPHYPADHPSSGPVETLALYLVAEAQFRGCVETKEAIKRWECNQPFAPYGPVRFSEKIQRFTPFSLGFEFLPGHHYYYSSHLTASECPSSVERLTVGPAELSINEPVTAPARANGLAIPSDTIHRRRTPPPMYETTSHCVLSTDYSRSALVVICSTVGIFSPIYTAVVIISFTADIHIFPKWDFIFYNGH
ncbi:ephrin-A4-like protein [Labeo rohita]|uniref:Ephrin-A4-like protein n=1 Tax=Labeo rohita TaxID=84645 RepID=A0A498LRG5_LABRO|nr:ephrin-A4-like protein [Labeo rohita]